MRIAQVAPLYEAVPPRLYGGPERVISFLTEGLVRRGHEVTLFASAESVTSARLVASRPRALRLDPGLQSATAAHLAMLSEVRRRSGEFDVIHVHISHFIHFPVLADVAAKTVTTPHGRLDYADLPAAYACWPFFPMISISMRQRRPLERARWIGNVYHGLPQELYPRRPHGRGDYVVFLGRMSRAKRPDRAIEIARRTGMKLKIAAKIGDDDNRYYREEIKPLLGSGIEFVGEVDEPAKTELLSDAAAMLFPIDWPEPFGLVVIEAMAFGVPVVAWREGAMPEIIDEGETGFVVDSIEAAVEALAKCAALDRDHVRRVFERRFSAERMVSDYEAIYRELTAKD
jgi:glycosyltransferase involved in cell wall biosynthesis